MECLLANRQLYRLFDAHPGAGCEYMRSAEEAFEWNERQWGIFWTVNQFKNPGERKKESLEKILAWAVDIDEGTKLEQIKLIQSFAEPSVVIETKKGFHVYYEAKDATAKNFDEIMLRIITALNGDPKAKDVSRILRVPGFVHWKNPNEPFPVKLVHSAKVAYTERDMLAIFPEIKKKTDVDPEQFKKQFSRELKFQTDDDLYRRVYSLDCEDALMRISGTEASGHELISFRRVSSGNLNIFTNGNPTSCFIDREKRIGGGGGTAGPTIWQWIKYYKRRTHKETYALMKKYFPEVVNG